MPPFRSHPPAAAQAASSKLLHAQSLRSLVPSIDYHGTISQYLSTPLTQTRRSLLQPLAESVASIFRRQPQQQNQPTQVNPNILPTTYPGINTDPPPGTVVGILLGSVAGFILLLWLIYTCCYLNVTDIYEEEEIVRRSSGSRGRRSSRSRSEMTHHRRSSSRHHHHHSQPPPQQGRRETIIVEERRTQAAPAVVVVDEEDDGGGVDDIVEVIEEHSPSRTPSPPPRRARGAGRRSGDYRRESEGYYRTVDPHAFGGGSGPARKVGRR